MAGQPHRLQWESDPSHVRVEFNGETIVDTDGAHVLREGRLPPVFYVPLEDVRGDLLERTAHSSVCPFKGRASYWSIVVGDRRAENALWAYEDPIDEAPYLRGYGAFYEDRVDSFATGPAGAHGMRGTERK